MVFKLPGDPTIAYKVNDKLRCEVLSISYTTRQVTLGMKGFKVSPEVLDLFPLGWIQDSDTCKFKSLKYHDYRLDALARMFRAV